MKWAVCGSFCDYLYYAKSFTAITDNNPLTHVMTTPRLNATSQRWVNELADFKFDIRYRPGRYNLDADALSRFPIITEFENLIDANEVNAILNANLGDENGWNSHRYENEDTPAQLPEVYGEALLGIGDPHPFPLPQNWGGWASRVHR